MGTLGLNSAKIASFQAGPFYTGLDLNLSQDFIQQPGYYKVASGQTIRAGMFVAQNASGELVVATTGAGALGVAKHNSMSLGRATVVDEAMVVVANAAVSLAHANVSSVVIVRTAVEQGGTLVTAAGDFTLNDTNGTLTWDAVPTQVADGATVYVTYDYALVDADYDILGRNFVNTNNDATANQSRLALLCGRGTLFTTEFVKNQTAYAVGTALYVSRNADTAGTDGMLTSIANGPIVGRVTQLPSAAYPYLGAIINIPVAAS